MKDRDAAARVVADALGLGEPTTYGPFAVIESANGASLDFPADSGEIQRQHYAFPVGEDVLDRIHQGLRDHGVQWWADRGG